MRLKYTLLFLAVLGLSLVYYFFSNKTKEVAVNEGQPQLLQSLVGQTVTLRGEPADAKMGAVLLVETEPVYIQGLENWSKNLLNKQIVVSGKLVFKNYLPQAESAENGEISQGGSDEKNYVLEDVDVTPYR